MRLKLHTTGDPSRQPVPSHCATFAVRLVVEDGLPYRPARWHLWRDHRVFVPFATIQNWALADFSGYVAADELYDGPFYMLSVVDNRRDKRILSDVLDHDPTHENIRAFLGRLKTALVVRGLALCGVTTDGSALSPEPLREVFGKVRHQIQRFTALGDTLQKLFSPTLEKALTFLDDKRLPATSNAVARGNRR